MHARTCSGHSSSSRQRKKFLDFSMKGSPGEMTMAYFNVVPEKQMQWWNQYQLVIEEGITDSRHMMQTLIGKDLKSKFT